MSDGQLAAVIVLAAGEGKRMRSATPKVLHELAGRSMLGHVLAAAEPLGAGHTAVVVGRGRDQVEGALAQLAPYAKPVLQPEQNGTGHAVRLALEALPELTGTVLVLPGDTPLLTTSVLGELVATHVRERAAATLLTAVLGDPTGYGRLLRDDDGLVRRIVEHRDATAEERTVTEVGTSVYAFDAALLRNALGQLTTENDQGEEYLTDVIEMFVRDGRPVAAVVADDSSEIMGINDRAQLATVHRLLRDRMVDQLMRDGVTVVDPMTTWIDVGVVVEPDATVAPNVHLHGHTVIRSGAVVGPDCTLVDTTVGPGASVVRSHCVGAEVGPAAIVGPYAYLRPGAVLADKAKVGTFVEVKGSEIGTGAKVPHLTYVGDATIGEGTNIGASSVFVNYDGVRKHHTVIGRHARTGSDTMFVAPVTVGDGAYTAAGSVITEDVPPGAMAVARARQRIIERWVIRRRAGTRSAAAASEALEQGRSSGEIADERGESEG